MLRRLALLCVVSVASGAGTGCYTFTCNDECEARIECMGQESLHPQECAEACVEAMDTETEEQRTKREACWDCIDKTECEAEGAGACDEVCS